MRKYCFPAWIIYSLILVGLSCGSWWLYQHAYHNGAESLACAPDPDWGGMTFDCYKASFNSRVMCPCNSDTIACLDILQTQSFTPQEKAEKVRQNFGSDFHMPPLETTDCKATGECPAGDCVTWNYECEMKNAPHDKKCCIRVIAQ